MKYYPLLGLSLLFISHLALAQQPVASAQSQKVLTSQAARFAAMMVNAKLKVGEKNVETTIRFLEVYHLKKGTWQVAAWQAARYVSG